jgi:hypothetical protein
MAVKRTSRPALVDSWMAKDDCRTLVQAEEIKRDRKRFAAAQKSAKEQKEALGPILRGKPQ